MVSMEEFFYRRSRQRNIKRCTLWLLIGMLILCVIFLRDPAIQTVSNNVLKHKTKYMAETGILKIQRHSRSLDTIRKLPALDFDITSQALYQDLRSNPTPSIILHYIWCKQRYFEFRHYLALKSAINVIKPDAIYFHYSILPQTDKQRYYTWFHRIQGEVSHFILNQIDTSCQISGLNRAMLALNLLHQFGGIYIPESSIIVDFPIHLIRLSFVSGIRTDSSERFYDGLIIAQKLNFPKPETADQLQVLLNLEVKDQDIITPCCSETQYKHEAKGVVCVNIEKSVNPKDIWFNKTEIAMLARLTMYGVSEIEYTHSLEDPIPRIAHYVCVFNCELSFLAYVSMLSAIHVARLQMVFVHGPVEPSGVWWRRLSTLKQFVYLHKGIPGSNHDSEPISQSLATNLMRLSILLKHGGVYQDQNTLWTQRIPDSYFQFNAVVALDWHMYGAWPDSINHGVMMAKKGAEYVSLLQAMFVKQRQDPAWFVDHYLSYKIVEDHPEIVFIDPRLQVKCLNHNCHPTWQREYRSTLLQNKPGKDFTWWNETRSLHWVDDFPQLDSSMVRYTSGAIIDICRFILRTAGVAINSI